MILIWTAVAAETALGRPEWDVPLTLAGGLVLLGAHGLNLHLCRTCRRCAPGRTLASKARCPGLVRERDHRNS